MKNYCVKKYIACLLAMISILSLCGCNQEKEKSEYVPHVVTYAIADEPDPIVTEEKKKEPQKDSVFLHKDEEYSCLGSIMLEEGTMRIEEGVLSVNCRFYDVPARFNETVLTKENLPDFIELVALENKSIRVENIDDKTSVFNFGKEKKNRFVFENDKLSEFHLEECGDVGIEVFGFMLGGYVSDINSMHLLDLPEDNSFSEVIFKAPDKILNVKIDNVAQVIIAADFTKRS